MAYLEMKHVSKYFDRVAANVDVNLSIEKGEVHALLGENGAGKSTLMNILYGVYHQSEGELFLDGEKLHIKDPKDAIEKGIGMVHQHFMLIPELTVIENVVLGMRENKAILDLKAAAQKFEAMSEKYGMHINPWVKVDMLTVGHQQRLEILKALYRNANILILDEPTAVLTPQEVGVLFKVIRQLTAEGKTIIFISHKMNEIMEICDYCTVLRRGRTVQTVKVSDIKDKQELATLMVGHAVELNMHKSIKEPGNVILKVDKLTYTNKLKVDKLKEVTFDIHEGEIVGICGVDDNGQSELIKCITGNETATKGHVTILDEDCTHAGVRHILDKGVSHIPEDRHNMAMIKNLSINENLILMALKKDGYSKHGFIDWKWVTKHNQELCREYEVKTPDVNELAGNLSGGNQQKFVVGRELDRNPKILVAMHPDRGLDIGATKYIQRRILAEREKGTGVVLVSTELDEIMELSDKIVVLNNGEVMGILDQKEATVEKLGLMMAGERMPGYEKESDALD
ncbi:ABC transporter ATP-binding protein [Hespellia stercorisuis]|uniref:Nucleoside ABC transporter ATP-binding protein n=1 Tax=Hespellia stercorisuis DSM 15480 TaxID=1121950 RepID=A0A1M6VDB1_9FIRM|nr:ABC transporter ATP-binding protein [Hespellia stercorisuis]SHK79527.1 nucleoside ABC transporter ATP-binding protein [Hespellia stercorisuis DSM 15480]